MGKKDPASESGVLARFKQGKEKRMIRVPAQETEGFIQSLTNVFRLEGFRNPVVQQVKRKRGPTQQNPNSKRTVRERERKKRIQKRKVDVKNEKKAKRQREEYLYNLAKGIKQAN